MAKRSTLRASDADRERIAERLKQAATEGRLLANELEDRLVRTFRAQTYGELDSVVADLPGPVARRQRHRAHELALQQPILAAIVLLAATIGFFVLAALVLAGVAFGGVWMILGVIFLIHRSGRFGGRPPRSRGGHRRRTYWVP
jgi:hypothetical protein